MRPIVAAFWASLSITAVLTWAAIWTNPGSLSGHLGGTAGSFGVLSILLGVIALATEEF